MVNRNSKKMYAGFVGILAVSFLFAFLSVSYASQDELDKVKNDIWTKGKRWVAEETEVSKLPDHERKMRLGLLKPLAASPVAETAETPPSEPLTGSPPPGFDWRNFNGINYVTGVRNQGNCGSCWAFATTAALESNLIISSGANTDLSEQILVSCGNAGSCSGGYPTTASSFIRDTGLAAESYYPYTTTNGNCAYALAGWQNATSRITSWHYVGNTTSPTLDQIKSELVTYGPLVTTFDVYSDFYYYGGGVYQQTSGTYQGGHAVLIVGYDDVGQYFIVKNSWGGGWGESGYFRIGYSELDSIVNFGDWSLAYYTDTTPPGITVATPNGGDSWAAGTTKTIQWNYTGAPGTSVKIELYKDGKIVQTITSSASIGSGGSGSYSWNIPQTLAAGNLYQIMVTSNQNNSYSDVSDGYFTISAYVPPTITLTCLNSAGITWKRNTTQQITWAYTGSPGAYVKIDLLKGGAVVKTIASKASITPGYYNWKVPSKQAVGNDYKIRITSTTSSAFTDTSDSAFTIN